jgi:nucleoside-diphosphate-sugar epimerase
MNELIQDRKEIDTILRNVFNEYVSQRIIILLISNHDIKNIIGEEIIKYVDEHPDKKWDWEYISYNPNTTIVNGPVRPGDIRDSLADISLTQEALNYTNPILFDEGMDTYLKFMFAN